MNNARLSGQSVVLICVSILVAGCNDEPQQAPALRGSTVENPYGLQAMWEEPWGTSQLVTMAAPALAPRETDTLAYEHTVTIETPREVLPTRLREIEAACNGDRTSGCQVLDVALTSRNNLPSGSIRMRLARTAVEPMVALASKGGEVTERTTRAEDLAEPVTDTERQLALMTVHRDRLTELMKSKDTKIDQLITVSKELATVQSQIDALSTQRAQLRRRIDTQLLTIGLTLPMYTYTSEQSHITDALREFGSDFRSAVGMIIRFLAVLLPWLVVVIPGLFLVRFLWRWIGRTIDRRERRGQATTPATAESQ